MMNGKYFTTRGYTLIEALLVVIVLSLMAIVAVGYQREQERRRRLAITSRSRGDMRTLATCIESYFIDNGSYPAAAKGALGANNVPGATSQTLSLSTFRIKAGPDDPLATLTTPIAYCNSYFSDRYAVTKRTTYGYCPTTATMANGEIVAGWIMWSAGPDRDYDIDPEADYSPLEMHPLASLIAKTFDPTNGTRSDGDIWRARR